MLPKVYVFSNSVNPDYLGHVVLSMAESGHVLGSHLCSSPYFFRHDLTETERRKEDLSAHYPNGYEVVVLPVGEIPPQEVLDRNEALADIAEELDKLEPLTA